MTSTLRWLGAAVKFEPVPGRGEMDQAEEAVGGCRSVADRLQVVALAGSRSIGRAGEGRLGVVYVSQ